MFGHRLSCVKPSLTYRVRYSEQNRHRSAFKLHEYFTHLCVLFSRGFQLWPVSFLHKYIYILFFSEIKHVGSLVWRKEKMPSWYSELKDVKVSRSEEGFGNPGWKWEFSKQSFQLVCSLSSLQVLGSIKKTARLTIRGDQQTWRCWLILALKFDSLILKAHLI